MAFHWTTEHDETVRSLAAAGHSASQIAAVLGTTRNAVIGRAHRQKLGLDKGRSVKARSEVRKAKEAAKPERITTVTLPKLPVAVATIGEFKNRTIAIAKGEVKPQPSDPKIWASSEAVAEAVAKHEAYGVTFMDLGPRSCRYPLGGKKEPATLFCGHETRKPGESWCAWHHGIVYHPTPKKKARPQEFRFAAFKAVAR